MEEKENGESSVEEEMIDSPKSPSNKTRYQPKQMLTSVLNDPKARKKQIFPLLLNKE